MIYVSKVKSNLRCFFEEIHFSSWIKFIEFLFKIWLISDLIKYKFKFTHDVWVEIGVFFVGAADDSGGIDSCFGRDASGAIVCIVGFEWGVVAISSWKALATAKSYKNNSTE